MKLKITAGTTSKLARIFVQDSSATDGSGLTGLVHNSAGLTWYWIQDGDSSPTAVTPVTATVGTWTSGGFKEVDSTNMPGVYELGLPDASLDANGTTHMLLKGATNMAPVAIEIECDAFTYLSANATAASIAALNDPTAAEIADAVWDEATAGHVAGGSFGKMVISIYDSQIAADGQVNDVSATTTSFVTNLTEASDDHYNDAVITFVTGNLSGQSRVISDYNGTTKTVTLDEALTEAPANGDEFLIKTGHVHTQTGIADAVLTTQMTESYAADGVAPTLAQAMFATQQFLQETNITGTTLKVRQLDGVTTAMTFTLNNATDPTDITRAS